MKKSVTRQSRSTTQHGSVKLRQVKTSDYSHRNDEVFTDDKLQPLAESLVQEGQQVELTVAETGKEEEIDGKMLPIYELIGGYRRHAALQYAIRTNMDVERINDDMSVQVAIKARGKDQSQEEFASDCLIQSVSENEQRQNFSEEEKLRIVKEFREAGISDVRGASALAISETQYSRFATIVECEWLLAAVNSKEIGTTHAHDLLKSARKYDREEHLRCEFERWVKATHTEIEEEVAEKRRAGKKVPDSDLHIRRRLDKATVDHWIVCLTAETPRPFTEGAFDYGVIVGEKEIEIPSLRMRQGEYSSTAIRRVINALNRAQRKLVPIMLKQVAVEAAAADLPDEAIDAALEQISKEADEEDRKRLEANAGRDVAANQDEAAEQLPDTGDEFDSAMEAGA